MSTLFPRPLSTRWRSQSVTTGVQSPGWSIRWLRRSSFLQTTSKELMFGILQQRHQNIHPCSPLLKIQRATKHLKFSMPLKKEKALTNRILDQKTKTSTIKNTYCRNWSNVCINGTDFIKRISKPSIKLLSKYSKDNLASCCNCGLNENSHIWVTLHLN